MRNKLKNIHGIAMCLLAGTLSSCTHNGSDNLLETMNTIDSANGIIVPQGFNVTVFADELGAGRHITVSSEGIVYVALRELKNNGGIVALKDKNNDGKADITSYFGETLTTGIEHKNGYLYYSNYDEIYRVPVKENELVPAAETETIVTGFLSQDLHPDKTFALDNDGNIYVNVGSSSNTCQEKDRIPGSMGIHPCPELERQAGIWRFKTDETNQDQVNHGYRYASGIRNSVAITWNASNDKLYVVQHGRDRLHQDFPESFSQQQGAELPAEEFLLVEDGDFFGWPYCYYNHIENKKMANPEYSSDTLPASLCQDARDPILAFPGHYAPNDVLFYTGDMFPAKYKEGAFIAFHGSWNRAPLEQKGYLVAFVPIENGLPSGDWEIFATGFAGSGRVTNLNNVKYRPTGLAQGPDGSLYISDSVEGRIWRISYSE